MHRAQRDTRPVNEQCDGQMDFRPSVVNRRVAIRHALCWIQGTSGEIG